MSKIDGLHPNAVWCSSQVVENMKSTGLKVEAEGNDLRHIEPVVLDPEELILELEVWNVAKDPPPEHTMDMWNYVNPEFAKAKAEAKETKKKAREAKQAEKAALKKANKPPKEKKPIKPPTKKAKTARKTKKGVRSLPEFPGFPAYYPPAGHLIDFQWGGDWYEGKFLMMEVDGDGDELCHLEDTTTNDTHKVLLREKVDDEADWVQCCEWVPLFYCNHCGRDTPGHIVCFGCSIPNNGDEDWCSDDSN
jgi:hypothetical protein